jgi:hypothetical protein
MKVKWCCPHGVRIKVVDDTLRACMYPKPDKSEKEIIVFDTGVVMLGGIKYCPFCGKKVEVEYGKEQRNNIQDRKAIS